MTPEQKSISQLLADLADQVSQLIRQELQLVRAETAEKASTLTSGLMIMAGGMMVALAALLVLVQALVVALADYMPDEIAALIVGGALSVVAFLLIRLGGSSLKVDNLVLPQTQESLRRDRHLVAESLR